MSQILANAESWDPTQTELLLVLSCCVTVAVVAVLVGWIIVLTRRQGHRRAPQIAAVATVWGLATIASAVFTTITQLKWAKSNLLGLLSGYADPSETAPSLPWALWAGLAAAYVAIFSWTLSDKK